MWRALDDSRCRPWIVVIEVNSHAAHPPRRAVAEGMTERGWDGHTDFFGASLPALVALAAAKGYTAVHCESHGVNCFFVRNDLLCASAAQPPAAARDATLIVASPCGLDRVAAELLHRAPNFYGRGWSYPARDDSEWVDPGDAERVRASLGLPGPVPPRGCSPAEQATREVLLDRTE